jgi:hypothetical protein
VSHCSVTRPHRPRTKPPQIPLTVEGQHYNHTIAALNSLTASHGESIKWLASVVTDRSVVLTHSDGKKIRLSVTSWISAAVDVCRAWTRSVDNNIKLQMINTSRPMGLLPIITIEWGRWCKDRYLHNTHNQQVKAS